MNAAKPSIAAPNTKTRARAADCVVPPTASPISTAARKTLAVAARMTQCGRFTFQAYGGSAAFQASRTLPLRQVALPIGFVDVKVCAVDEVWSGLKLVIRRELRGQ